MQTQARLSREMEIWDKYKLGIRAGKYKLEARTGKYKFGARGRARGPRNKQRAGGWEIQIPNIRLLLFICLLLFHF